MHLTAFTHAAGRKEPTLSGKRELLLVHWGLEISERACYVGRRLRTGNYAHARRLEAALTVLPSLL
jgi:hypothetical protein